MQQQQLSCGRGLGEWCLTNALHHGATDNQRAQSDKRYKYPISGAASDNSDGECVLNAMHEAAGKGSGKDGRSTPCTSNIITNTTKDQNNIIVRKNTTTCIQSMNGDDSTNISRVPTSSVQAAR